MALYELDGVAPQLGQGAYVADSATAIGRVIMGDNASLWFGVVARADSDTLTIGRNCIVGAGSVVTEGKEFPDNSLIIGAPAKVVRTLDDAAAERLRKNADHYVENARRFAKGLKKIG
jgi:carbonic anhydrase/acetyltransferase-like protein (isoleucine patch superfamily)